MSALPILLATAAVLAGVLTLELATGAARPQMRPAASAVASPAAVPPADQTPQLVASLLARPPFAPNRRPDPVQGADDPRLPHLTGILVTGQDRRAIFAGREGALGIVVHEGDQLGAYRVQGISPTDVTLGGTDGAHILRPTFSAAAPPAATPPTLPMLALPQILPPAALGTPLQTPNAPALPAAGTTR